MCVLCSTAMRADRRSTATFTRWKLREGFVEEDRRLLESLLREGALERGNRVDFQWDSLEPFLHTMVR